MSTSKEPPINILDMFLTRHGLQDKTTPCSVCVDQGGEFAHSEDFRKIVSKHGYVIEPTGSDTPSQNGRVERLNQPSGIMVRSHLNSSVLPTPFSVSRATAQGRNDVFDQSDSWRRAVYCKVEWM
jgi:hypothetical protein